MQKNSESANPHILKTENSRIRCAHTSVSWDLDKQLSYDDLKNH